uniref:C2H2-type domain-containing protein n=2 Tax=Schizophyllum commune (strain H4-8 / FGSC 9210) TaxID=578458 RepID=D8Q323_SCHCM
MPIPAISKPANQSNPPKANPPAIAPPDPANSAGTLQRPVEDHLPANWLLEPAVRIRPGEPIDCGDGVLARHVDCLCTLEAENDEVCGKRCAHGHIQWVMHCFANHMTKEKQEIMGWRCGFAGCTTKAKSRRDQVRNHYLNKHHPDKLYACQACGERFKSADDLRSHERKTHGGEDAAGSTSASVCASASKTPAIATRKRDRSVSGAHAPEKLRKTSSTRRMPMKAGGTPVDPQPCVAPSRARPISPLPGWTPLPEATEHPQQAPTADSSRECAQVQPRQGAPPRAAPAAARVSSSTTRRSPPPTIGWPTSYERSAVNRGLQLSTTRESSVVSLESWATPPPITPLESTSKRSSYHSLAVMQEAEASEATCNEATGVHGENEHLDDEPVQDPAGRREADDDNLDTEDDEEDQLLSSEGHEDLAEGEYASDVEFELKYLTVVQQSEEVLEPFDEDDRRSARLEDDPDHTDDLDHADDLDYADDLEYADD